MATCAISATEANVIPAASVKGRDDSQINLVKRAQAGDEQAFATLFQQHKNRVYSVCLLMTKDVAEAEDLTQEAFLQVFRTVEFVSWGRCILDLALSGCRQYRADEASPAQISAHGFAGRARQSRVSFLASRLRQERSRTVRSRRSHCVASRAAGASGRLPHDFRLA